MDNRRDIIITVYGHDKTIDKIALSSFDRGENYDSNAKTYCDTINSLELSGNAWICAKIVPENTPFTLDSISPVNFDTILKLDNLAIQKILRNIDTPEIAVALRGAKDIVKEKIFKNMSKNAAQMLKEDMDCMGPLLLSTVQKSQHKIVNIIRHLEEIGEIVIAKGDIVK